MLDNVFVFRQSSIKIAKDIIIYFDPFKINEEWHDADIIFITHNHYDHYDVDSIKNVIKNDTLIVVPKSMYDEAFNLFGNKVMGVLPNMDYSINSVTFKTVRAYNNNKSFHPKENDWLGYVVTIDGYTYYVMGDSDDTSDARCVSCDVLFVPIGGTYTMNRDEAAIFTNFLKPKVAVPIHYGSIVGNMEDGSYFVSKLDSCVKGVILINN